MATYKWRATTSYQSDTSLSYGVTPNTYQSWQTASTGSASTGEIDYWYRDANVSSGGAYTDANSSRANIYVTDSWTASVDDLNNLTITINTTINSVTRDDLRGSNQNTPGRDIRIYREQGGQPVLSLQDTQLASAHTIWSGPLTLPEYTFTLAPGQSAQRSSLYVHNQTTGYSSYDDIWVGAQFLNDLPAPTTYRLQYDANGGSGAPATQSHTTAQSSWTTTVSSTQPTWGLYKFLGWSTVRHTESCTPSDVEYSAGDSITLTSGNPTRTLYAVWMKDYRPGTSLDTNTSVWKSHNRTNGACHVRTNSGWQECRTIGGDEGEKGNAPSMIRSAGSSTWYNQRRLGKEA